jgi:hypothetical protein
LNHVISILQKIFAREFYRTNTSLFLIVLGLGIGFMKGEDHALLAEIIVGSPVFALFPFLVWFLYSILIVDFNLRATRRPENAFAWQYALFPYTQQWALAFSVAFVQFLPAIAYGIFLALTGVKFKMWLSAVLLLTSLAVLFTVIAALLRQALRQPGKEDKISKLSQQISRNITRTFATFSLEGLLRAQPLSILGSKAAGFAVVWASLALYSTDTYDSRLLGLGIAIGISFNAGTISQWHYLDNVSFQMIRSLPYSLIRRSIMLLSSFALFMLPEVGLLIANFPGNLSILDEAGSILFAISIPYVAYSFMFTKAGTPERFPNYHFFSTLTWVVLILCGTPLIVTALINFGIGAFFWKASYYNYEFVVKQDDAD